MADPKGAVLVPLIFLSEDCTELFCTEEEKAEEEEEYWEAMRADTDTRRKTTVYSYIDRWLFTLWLTVQSFSCYNSTPLVAFYSFPVMPLKSEICPSRFDRTTSWSLTPFIWVYVLTGWPLMIWESGHVVFPREYYFQGGLLGRSVTQVVCPLQLRTISQP